MPSEHQNASQEDSHRNMYHKVFATEIDPEPLLNGIDSYDKALLAHQEAIKNDARSKYKKFIATQLRRYSD